MASAGVPADGPRAAQAEAPEEAHTGALQATAASGRQDAAAAAAAAAGPVADAKAFLEGLRESII